MINFGFIFGTLDQIFALCFFILFNILFILFVSKKNKLALFRNFIIYLWHTAFCFIYLYLSLTSVSDSLSYFEDAQFGGVLLDKTPSVIFISTLNSFLIKFLNLSYLGVFLFYNFLGFLALLLIDKSINKIILSQNIITKLIKNFIIFLPSISFWSASIGKDTIALFSISLLFWLYLNKKNFLILFIVFLVFFIVRTQHALVLFLASILTLFFINNKNYYYINFKYFKLSIFVFLTLLTIFSLNYILSMTGTGIQITGLRDFLSLDFYNEFNEKLKARQNLIDYRFGTGYIDLQNMYFLSELYTYLFRPMIFEANTIIKLVSSIENLIILIFFIYGIYCFSVHKIIYDRDKIFIIFFISALIPLSVLTPNFGISARQKWIILIPIFYFLISSIDIYLIKKTKKKCD